MEAVRPGPVRRPIPIVHLIHGLELGGLEQLVTQLCVRSRDHGFAPSVIALGPDGPMGAVFEREQIPLCRVKARGMSLAALAGIRQVLGEWGAPLVHAHDVGPWLNAVAARALRPSTEVLATFHEQRVPSGAKRKASALAARFSFALVACGKQVETNLREWVPPGTRVMLIENGVPLPPPPTEAQRQLARQQLGIPNDAVAIGYLGRLASIKGPDLLLDGFLERFAGRSDVHLALIGCGPLEEELRERAAGRANVHFTGLVLDAAGLLAGLDIYAQTSRSEGRSLSMLEAMAAGLPTVAPSLDAVREVHHDGETALLVRPVDSRSIGDALERLCADPMLRARLGRQAREAVRHHSLDGTVEAYVGLYRRIACRTEQA